MATQTEYDDELYRDLIDDDQDPIQSDDTPVGVDLIPGEQKLELPPLPMPTIPVMDDDDEDDSITEDELDSLDDDTELGNEPVEGTNTLVDQLLASKGIKGSIIQYENDEGEIEEVDFYTLPAEEQLAILQSSDPVPSNDLDESEIQTINFLRQNNVTLEEAREYFRREAVQEYIDSQNIAGIEIDQYTDEELYALDFKAKYDHLTQEEIEIELEKQLEHPELFKRKVDKLRTDYKKIEEEQATAARLQQEAEEENKVTELQNSLVAVANEVVDIGGLDLDPEDKDEVLNFILTKDINGVSPFLKSLDSPKQLFELAWFAKKGKEAFDIIHTYYKKEIDSVSKASFEKGKASATPKSTKPVAPARKSHLKTNQLPTNNQRDNFPSMEDILLDKLKEQ